MPAIVRPMHESNARNGLAAILVSVCLLATFGGIGPAAAQKVGNALWCIDMANLGGYLECHYHTYEQCAATARGVTNVCVTNSWYVPRPPRTSRQRRDPRG